MKRIKHILLCISVCLSPLLASAQIADSLFRVVPVQGAYNFRDIGGYPTKDGRTVVSGKIYRSADIGKLTDQDLELLAERHICTVVDFRGTQEAAASPDRLLPGTDYTLCPVGSDHVGDPNDMISLLKDDNFLLSFYGKPSVQYAGDRFRTLFAKLMEQPAENAALLYHCTGGRDRTGMATALILYTLDVPMEVITEDYVASNFYLRDKNRDMYDGLAERVGISVEQLEEKMQLRPEFLEAFFSALAEEYGSVEAFLEKEFGMGQPERIAFRNKFTF